MAERGATENNGENVGEKLRAALEAKAAQGGGLDQGPRQPSKKRRRPHGRKSAGIEAGGKEQAARVTSEGVSEHPDQHHETVKEMQEAFASIAEAIGKNPKDRNEAERAVYEEWRDWIKAEAEAYEKGSGDPAVLSKKQRIANSRHTASQLRGLVEQMREMILDLARRSAGGASELNPATLEPDALSAELRTKFIARLFEMAAPKALEPVPTRSDTTTVQGPGKVEVKTPPAPTDSKIEVKHPLTPRGETRPHKEVKFLTRVADDIRDHPENYQAEIQRALELVEQMVEGEGDDNDQIESNWNEQLGAHAERVLERGGFRDVDAARDAWEKNRREMLLDIITDLYNLLLFYQKTGSGEDIAPPRLSQRPFDSRLRRVALREVLADVLEEARKVQAPAPVASDPAPGPAPAEPDPTTRITPDRKRSDAGGSPDKMTAPQAMTPRGERRSRQEVAFLREVVDHMHEHPESYAADIDRALEIVEGMRRRGRGSEIDSEWAEQFAGHAERILQTGQFRDRPAVEEKWKQHPEEITDEVIEDIRRVFFYLQRRAKGLDARDPQVSHLRLNEALREIGVREVMADVLEEARAPGKKDTGGDTRKAKDRTSHDDPGERAGKEGKKPDRVTGRRSEFERIFRHAETSQEALEQVRDAIAEVQEFLGGEPDSPDTQRWNSELNAMIRSAILDAVPKDRQDRATQNWETRREENIARLLRDCQRLVDSALARAEGSKDSFRESSMGQTPVMVNLRERFLEHLAQAAAEERRRQPRTVKEGSGGIFDERWKKGGPDAHSDSGFNAIHQQLRSHAEEMIASQYEFRHDTNYDGDDEDYGERMIARARIDMQKRFTELGWQYLADLRQSRETGEPPKFSFPSDLSDKTVRFFRNELIKMFNDVKDLWLFRDREHYEARIEHAAGIVRGIMSDVREALYDETTRAEIVAEQPELADREAFAAAVEEQAAFQAGHKAVELFGTRLQSGDFFNVFTRVAGGDADLETRLRNGANSSKKNPVELRHNINVIVGPEAAAPKSVEAPKEPTAPAPRRTRTTDAPEPAPTPAPEPSPAAPEPTPDPVETNPQSPDARDGEQAVLEIISGDAVSGVDRAAQAPVRDLIKKHLEGMTAEQVTRALEYYKERHGAGLEEAEAALKTEALQETGSEPQEAIEYVLSGMQGELFQARAYARLDEAGRRSLEESTAWLVEESRQMLEESGVSGAKIPDQDILAALLTAQGNAELDAGLWYGSDLQEIRSIDEIIKDAGNPIQETPMSTVREINALSYDDLKTLAARYDIVASPTDTTPESRLSQRLMVARLVRDAVTLYESS